MKIVDVCAFYSPTGGGVRTYVERKLAAAEALGHEVVIVAPGPERRVEARGAGRILTIPARQFPLDRNYHYFDDDDRLLATIDAERPDFLEASSPWRSAETIARWRGDAPRALVMHADPLAAYAYRWFGRVASRETINRHFGWFWNHLRRLDPAFDFVVTANRELGGRLSGGGLKHVVTVPMGVEPDLFSPAHRDAELRADLLALCNLPPDALLLIGVGRHAPEKRWPMVIDAVAAAGYALPVGLVLVGDGRSSDRSARAIGRNPHIAMLPAIADRHRLARLMASADALVHGCEAETFCMVAAEARASGVPVIVPDVGGAADHARGGGGLLYAAGDAASLAAAVRRFAADRRALGLAARASAPQSRTIDAHFADLFGLYASRVHAPRRAA
ncbi:MAG: glycosyl transferase family 1 [Sphingomonas sanxanigenens]|uniref:Glycosyl transferase family 1 n=1 Tax=Sphingomonas sanxanigenens TaxID=397260 RepID=A0A2W5C9I3_9SPHN|nr:MAG: glycosyl transferase family 1 [Sphingomonas sanxanigenens]